METGKFSDNLRVTENGLVSGVYRAFKSSNSTFQNIGDRLNPLGKSVDFESDYLKFVATLTPLVGRKKHGRIQVERIFQKHIL